MFPTPQTSTTSTNSWIKDEFGQSSEIDVVIPFDLDENKSFNTVKRSRSNSSWPFRSNSVSDTVPFEFDLTVDLDKVPLDRLKRTLQRDFPYVRIINRMKDRIKKLLFDRELWTFLLNVSAIYSGPEIHGDCHKKNEIAFAAWTTLLRVYAACRVRGLEQLHRLAVACVTLQAKLLEESDVDLVKLERKLVKLTDTQPLSKDLIQAAEKKITSLLNWKLLVPSPQVILFLCLDVLNAAGLALSASLKLLVSKVLDVLITDFVIHEYLQHHQDTINMASVVVAVIESVLEDYFSTFQNANSSREAIKKYLPIKAASLTVKFKEKIEKAIEKIMSES